MLIIVEEAMKRRFFLGGGCLVVVAAIFLGLANPFPGLVLPDKLIFNHAEAGLEFSITQFNGVCIADASERGNVTLKFLRDGNTVLVILVDRTTTFSSDGDVLFVAQPHRSSSGCDITTYSLCDGRMLWKRQLKALNDVTEDLSHVTYRNRVTLSLSPNAVTVIGSESYGEYVEVIERRVGWRLAHKVYRIGFLEFREGDDPFLPGS